MRRRTLLGTLPTLAVFGSFATSCGGVQVGVGASALAAEGVERLRIDGSAFELVRLAGPLEHPWGLAFLPDGGMLVTERPGRLRLIDEAGRLDPRPIDGVPRVWARGQGGLLDVALPPDFATSRLVYLAYAAPVGNGAATRVARGRLDGHRLADLEVLLTADPPGSGSRHFGSRLVFGRDGKLYVSTGDGGYANDWGIGHNVTIGNGQDLSTPLGKMLRFDVDSPQTGYIPADNPFVGRSDAHPAIWALGLRNPWRCSFDMGGDRALYCGDVQQNSFEEVSVITKGANLGWRRMEADRCFDYLAPNKHPADCDKTGLTMPILVYNNCTAIPQNCMGISVTGGYVYRGSHKAWDGKYIFGDWSKSFDTMDGQIFFATKGADGKWSMEKATVTNMEKVPYILAFAQDEQGEVYALTSITTGPVGSLDTVYKIVPAN